MIPIKKFKIVLLVFYIIIALILIYEAAIPGDISSKQHNFIKKIINNISKIFIKEKIVMPTDIVINNSFKETYYTNETLTLDVDVLPSNASYKELSCTSTNTNVLTVNGNGRITFLDTGKASIIVEQKDSKITKNFELNVIKYDEPIEELIEPEAIILKSVDDKTSCAIGDVIVFYLAFDKEDVNDYKFYLTSSDESICKTFDNYCYGVGVGMATIEVTHRTTGLTSSMNIEVTDGSIIEPTYYKLNGPDTIYINDNTKYTYTIDIDPNASNLYKEVRFGAYDINGNRSDDQVFDIGWNTGELYIYGYGEGYIYAYFGDTLSYYIKLSIKNILPEYELENKRIIIGESYKVVVNPTNKDNMTYAIYTYSSSDEEVASIDNLGNITPHITGVVDITVEVNDGFDSVSKSFELTVDNKVIEDDIGQSFGKIIRKGIAHFLGFIVFGFIAFMMFYMWIKPKYDGSSKYVLLLIGVNGLVFSILTEAIQLLSPGRDGTIRDVLLDYFGYTISFVISISILLIAYFITKKRKNNKKIEPDDNLGVE